MDKLSKIFEIHDIRFNIHCFSKIKNAEFVPISKSESNLINPDDLAGKEFYWERRNSYSEFGRTLSTKPRQLNYGFRPIFS